MIRCWLRADLRQRWARVVGLALLVAVFGGVVLAAVAGARRTASAYPRMLTEVNLGELIVSPSETVTDPDSFYGAMGEVPGVRDVAPFGGIPVAALAGSPTAAALRANPGQFGMVVVASLDGIAGYRVDRPRLLEGRMPSAERVDEALATQTLARRLDLEVGDRLDLVVVPSGLDGRATASDADGEVVRVEVTGIGVFASEVVPFTDLEGEGRLVTTTPFASLSPHADWGSEGAFIDVEPGADRGEVARDLVDVANDALGPDNQLYVTDQVAGASGVQDALRPLATALAVFAAATAAVATVVVAQSVLRSSRLEGTDKEAMRALGVSPRQQVLLLVGRSGAVGVLGAFGAAFLAVALSPWFPVGPARVAEPDPGVAVDGVVLVLGFGLIAGLVVVCVLPAAVLEARRTQPTRVSRSGVIDTASRSGMSLAAIQGLRFTLRAGHDPLVPLRSTLVTVGVAVTAVVAAMVFAASLSALVDTPARYGQGWDRMLDGQFSLLPAAAVIDRFRADPAVRGIAVGNYGDLSVNGVQVPAVSLRSVHGRRISLTIIEGQPAELAGEIALGGETLDRLGLEVGDTVGVEGGEGSSSYRIVGRAVFPRLGRGAFSTTGLGVGAQVADGVLPPLPIEGDPGPAYPVDGHFYSVVVFDLDRPDAIDRQLEEFIQTGRFLALIRTDQRPTTIRDLDRVRTIPGALAAVLALVAVAALAHLLVSSVRNRRRDLAVLRSLGFTGRELRVTIGWHATFVASMALIIGIPLGLIGGRLLWLGFSDGLDADALLATPWLWVAAAVAGFLLVANVVAAVPGHWAARTSPAAALRRE